MRPVDADAIIQAVCTKLGIKDKKFLLQSEKAIVDVILNAPTIDAVEVVRCKECKYWHDHITTTWCSRGAELRPQESGWVKRDADDFCSYGEREGE